MNELKSLEDRLKSATDRISAALSTHEADTNDADVAAQENAQLREKLDQVKAQRTADLAELDDLLEQLRPMMEEAADA